MAANATVAERLARLATTMAPADRGPWKPKEIAEATGLSPSYVGHLFNGTRENPSQKTIQVLARFFGVPAGYFFDDDEFVRVDEQLDKLDLLKVLRRRNVLTMAARLGDLSDTDLEMVSGVIDHLRQPDRRRSDASGRR